MKEKKSIHHIQFEWKPAKQTDLPNIRKWKLETVLGGYDGDIPKDVLDRIKSYIEKNSSKHLKDTYIITLKVLKDEPKNDLVGMICKYMKDGDLFIDELYIVKEQRSKGYGKEILSTLKHPFKGENYDSMSLYVYKNNEHAIHLYKSLGFKVVKDKSDPDRYFMRCKVNKKIKRDKVIDACGELCEAWSKFKYGIPKEDGRIHDVTSAEYYNKHYRFLSPEEFEKYGGGVCWDYVEWGAKFLRERHVEFDQYYIVTNTPPNYDTHTIIVCKSGGKYVYVESSFKAIADEIGGMNVYDTLEEIFKYITNKMLNYNNNRRFEKFKYSVLKYTSVPKYGSSANEYMDYMKKHGRLVYEGYVYNDKYKSESKSDRMYNESALTSKQRKELGDEQFGIPELRKYPLTDEKHVLQAVRFFNKAPDEYKCELAKNIVKRAKELDMDYTKWDVLKPYLNKTIEEFYLYTKKWDDII